MNQTPVSELFSRNIPTLSPGEQNLLRNSHVCIVGQGGLGGTVSEILARTGIGCLTLVDGDRFEKSNMNRQLLCSVDVLGESKVEVAKRRLQSINPELSVHCGNEYFNIEKAKVIPEKADVIVDCLDKMEHRFMLETAARKLRIPMVSAAVSGMSGYVTTVFPQDRGLQALLDNEERLILDRDPESISCLASIVFLMASLQSSEVIKILLKSGQLMRDSLLLVDLAENLFEAFSLD